MRQIKFRAKRLDNGEWICGDLHLRTPFAHIHSDLGAKANIDTDTIGQFTGLLDKNGKEVYEGDIVREKLKRARKDGDILQICFDDYEWCGKNNAGASTSFYLLATYHELEIVGNIYDNPQQLKGGD